MYPFENQWCAVINPKVNQGRDYIQVGDSDHRPGTSYIEKFGKLPRWAINAVYNINCAYVVLYRVI